MNVLIISKKFHPGHYSHLIAYYHLFEEIGYNPILFLHKDYNKYDENGIYKKINSIKYLDVNNVFYSFFCFPHHTNLFLALKLKLVYNSKILYLFHEPFDSIHNYYNTGFTIIKIIKIILIDIFNIIFLLLTNFIILPSNKSLRQFIDKSRYIKKKYTVIPLLFKDELESKIDVSNKIYISYIGTIAEDHAFHKFINFVIYAIDNSLFKDHCFLIATGSNLNNKHDRILEKYKFTNRIKIVQGSYLSNDEINSYYLSSILVWNAYDRTMQSGVLAKAFMFGTPVISLKKNSNEFVINLVTGIEIMSNDNVIEISNAISYVISNINYISSNCRNKFFNTFFYRSKIKLLTDFI